MSPNIEESFNLLIQQNCTEILLVPLFMSSGGHVKKDVVQLVERAKLDFPTVSIQMAEAIGEYDLIIKAMQSTIEDLIK